MKPKLVEVAAPHEPDQAPERTAAETGDPALEFRSAAQGYALQALEVLASLMEKSSSDAVKASAANSVIDRAHGRAAPAVRGGGSTVSEDAEGVEVSVVWQSPEKS